MTAVGWLLVMLTVGIAIDAWHGKPFYSSLLTYLNPKAAPASNKAVGG